MGISTGRKAVGALLVGAVMVGLAAGPVKADGKLSLEERLKKLEQDTARLKKLEKDNADLRNLIELLKNVPPAVTQDTNPYLDEVKRKAAEASEKDKLKKEIDAYLTERDAKKKADDTVKAKQKEAEGFEVGKSLDVKGRWTNNYLWFETEDKAFRYHIGGRTQIDYVGVHANQNMQVRPQDAGIGEFDNGVNFRRARFVVEGTFWEVFNFVCEYDFLNTFRNLPVGPVGAGNVALNNTSGSLADRLNVINTPVPTDLWIEWAKIPVIGNIRIGNQKPWISYEHLTSSRFLDFLERSSAFDAFVENGNNGFTPGISVWNTYLDDRIFVGAGVYTPNFRDIYGWNVGDGEAMYTARVAATPLYAENGRCMLHVGLAYQHSTNDDGVVRFRARNQLRNGPALLHNIFAIIQTQGHNYDLIVPELAFNYGPLNMSAEYYGAWVNQRRGEVFQNVGNQFTNLPAGSRGSMFYQGAYVTAGYFLTGEHRAYNKKTKAWDRQFTNEPAFFVDGQEGVQFGRGAWELLARYSWLDLNDKSVNGGTLHTGTFGVNWYLNPNAKLQLNYEIGYRDATQYGTGAGAVGGVVAGGNTSRDGVWQGVGTRFAFDF